MRDRGSESKAKIITRLESVILITDIEPVIFASCAATVERVFHQFPAWVGAINYRLSSITDRRPIYRHTERLLSFNSEVVAVAMSGNVTVTYLRRVGRLDIYEADLIQPVFA